VTNRIEVMIEPGLVEVGHDDVRLCTTMQETFAPSTPPEALTAFAGRRKGPLLLPYGQGSVTQLSKIPDVDGSAAEASTAGVGGSVEEQRQPARLDVEGGDVLTEIGHLRINSEGPPALARGVDHDLRGLACGEDTGGADGTDTPERHIQAPHDCVGEEQGGGRTLLPLGCP
jgi:hypothetical protein